MTLKLCWLRHDAACAMVRKALDFKGLDYTLAEADEEQAAQNSPATGSPSSSSGAHKLFEEPRRGEHRPHHASSHPTGAPHPIPERLPALTLVSGETLTGTREIIRWLESEYPEPALLPRSHAGLHRTLARYFEGELGAAMLRAAMPHLLKYYRAQEPHLLVRYVGWVERRMGAGFCARAERQAEANRALARELLAPLEDELSQRAFLVGRIGLADFALYAQLCPFACAGELQLPGDFAAVREHFLRIDRITARLQAE